MARVVVQRPDWGDMACRWGSWWLKDQVIPVASNAGFLVSDLYASNANRNKVLSECNRQDFVYFSGIGHGNATTFTGQNMGEVFWVGDGETRKICNGKHFNFLSCSFGKVGAKWMVASGRANGVHAYDADFVFLVDGSSFPDGVAKPFFDAHTTVDRELLGGATHLKAHRKCKLRYDYWILNAPAECRRYLVWDRNHKVFYGKLLGLTRLKR